MTHSPAPWKWEDDGCDVPHLVDVNGNHVIYLGASPYPDDPGGCGHMPDKEDAALIAASPDLLAACKLAANILEHSYDVNEAEYPQSIECLKHLREVISKAEPKEIK